MRKTSTLKPNLFEKIFKLKNYNTNIKTEIMAGITTFMTLAYILVVNPMILADAGMDKGAVFVATALSAVIATFVMGLLANYPIALAPGMGLNALFAYTIVIELGYTWQFALCAVFIEGLLFILLIVTNLREKIVDCIPANLNHAVTAGVGLFIAYVGLSNANIVVDGSLGDIHNPLVLLTLGGLLLTSILVAKNKKGALLISILLISVVGMGLELVDLPSAIASFNIPSIEPVFLKAFTVPTSKIFSLDMLIIVIILLFVDLFNTVGCLVGTSTVTSFVESAAGIGEGGKTGLTAITTAVLFLLSLLFAPLFTAIPTQATAPVLIVVGVMMASSFKEIDFSNYTNAIPAFILY